MMRPAVIAFLVALALAVCSLSAAVYVIVTKANEGSETHAAICALVGDLEARTVASREFLKEHPEGLPGLATAAQIRESVHNQERTRDALGVVSC